MLADSTRILGTSQLRCTNPFSFALVKRFSLIPLKVSTVQDCMRVAVSIFLGRSVFTLILLLLLLLLLNTPIEVQIQRKNISD